MSLGYFPAFLVLSNLITMFLGIVSFMLLLLEVSFILGPLLHSFYEIWIIFQFCFLKVGHLKSYYRSMMLFTFFKFFSPLCVLFWIVHCYDKFNSNLIISSSVMSNLPLILSTVVFFITASLDFILEFWFEYTFHFCNYLFEHSPHIVTALSVSLTANSKTCVAYESLSINLLFFSSFSCFFSCLIIFHWKPDIVNLTLLYAWYFVFLWILLSLILECS